ncbi:MAG: NAD-dependent deacylase [bacterium]|nr:NAD-dependent deacylase [bacterium]
MDISEISRFLDQWQNQLTKTPLVIAVVTGAGISAESGIPTFRGPTGYWSQFKFEELASREGFLANPERVQDWYTERRLQLAVAEPNPAHYALVKLECAYPNTAIITQNVDGLHRRAGTKNLWELHGSLAQDKCFECETPYLTPYHVSELKIQRCISCHGRIRPAVVWFGESLPTGLWEQAEQWIDQANLCIVIGTQGSVWPAAGLLYRASRNGTLLLEINPGFTDISHICEYHLQEKAGDVLPVLVNEMIPIAKRF